MERWHVQTRTESSKLWWGQVDSETTAMVEKHLVDKLLDELADPCSARKGHLTVKRSFNVPMVVAGVLLD